jgi:radical SAM protein with 4Fe4S-binding SPASM domain
MPLNHIRKIIQDFRKLGGEILEVSGGEPLVHPNILEIIEFATQSGIVPILYTSGNMFDVSGRLQPIDYYFAKKLYSKGLRHVVFNLQGSMAYLHDNITCTTGSYDNTLRSIKTMKSLGFWVGVHFVPTKLNYSDLEKVHSLCHQLMINEMGILRFVPQGRGCQNRKELELSDREFEMLAAKLTSLTLQRNNPSIRVGRPIDFRFLCDPRFGKARCDAGLSRCLITPHGHVMPCPAFKQAIEFKMGNVCDESLIDIWAKSTWKIIRQFDYTQLDEPCRSCRYLHKCKGGCIAQRVWTYDDIYACPDPACFKNSVQMTAVCPLRTKPRKELELAQK